MNICSIDTGSHFAAALFDTTKREPEHLVDVFYDHTKGGAFKGEQFDRLYSDLTKFCEQYGDLKDTLFVIEAPSHRYFGRGNSSALLKTMWQVLRLYSRMMKQAKGAIIITAPLWNKQRGDTEKRSIFELIYPDHDQLPYYQAKHGSRSNAHERDAVLLGRWAITQLRLGTLNSCE